MTRQRPETWISGKAALAILKGNSGRDDIPESYIRTLALKGKVQKRAVAPGVNEYLLSDVENYVVKRRNEGKGDTRAARAAGSRRKASA
jgi:hypothetical protein